MKTGIRDQHSATSETLWRKHRLLSRLSLFVVVSLVDIIGFALPQTTFAAEADLSPSITVQVNNYSQASPAALAEAEREAGRILGEAGLQALWLECPVGPSSNGPQGPCQKAPEATEIRLRVLSAPIRNGFQDTVFGFTVHPVLASVYYEYAVRRARSDKAEFEVPKFLGCVMAHEIGHLLLGSNGHSSTGIMQPRWEPKQVRQLMMGTLLFTPEQSKLMRAQARTRMRLQMRTLKEERMERMIPRPDPGLIPQND